MLNNGKASIPKKSVSNRTSDKKGIQTKSKAIQKKKPVNKFNTSMQVSVATNVLSEIRELLVNQPYAGMFLKALGPKGDLTDLITTLETDPHFKKFDCFGSHERAILYANDLAGLGLIESLLARQKEPITDIGFNSTGFLTIETTEKKYVYGNQPGQPKITRKAIEALIFRLAQQEGSTGKSFTATNPLFNGSKVLGDGGSMYYLRVSANHEVVAPEGITMSIRVSRPRLAITKQNFNFSAPFNDKVNTWNFLALLVQSHCNILLSAETGAGKTEFQKMLIGFISTEDRIITVEDTVEMHLTKLYPKKDIFSWLTNENVSVTDLIKQALRNNPKWLIIAETRGSEAYEMFQGVKSDHCIITTLHAASNLAVPSRFTGMASMGYNINEEKTERDFLRYMHIGIHLTKQFVPLGNGRSRIMRYVDEIAEFVPESSKYPDGINVLLKQHIGRDGMRSCWLGAPSEKLKDQIFRQTDINLDKMRSDGRTMGEYLWPSDIYTKDNPLKEKVY